MNMNVSPRNLFPFLSFIISSDKDNRIPMMGLFISKDEVVEFDIDDFVNAIDKEQHGLNYPYMHIATLSKINQRELVIHCNMDNMCVDFYVGRKNSILDNISLIDTTIQIPLFKVSLALDDFVKKSEEFVKTIQNQ